MFEIEDRGGTGGHAGTDEEGDAIAQAIVLVLVAHEAQQHCAGHQRDLDSTEKP